MRVVADLHIHSKYSRATSADMDLRSLSTFAPLKGLDLLGTGDITHPSWLEEVRELLEEDQGKGLYLLKERASRLRFMMSSEVSTVYMDRGKSRRVHHVVLFPSLEVAQQACDGLNRYGDLASDGRPTLSIGSSELVEVLTSISSRVEIFPAHAWTPWYSIFGSISGFDAIEECYADQTRYIHALETGLSSDPLMNWRVSKLDVYTLLSNSDCHSPLPHRLGREANVFEVEGLSYDAIIDAIRKRGTGRLLFTIETKPEYGKYHWTGHRACNVSLPPREAIALGNRCPKCKKKLTLGVEQRVVDLADRPHGYRPEGMPGYVYLLPLHELLGVLYGESSILTRRTTKAYDSLIRAFGSEINTMLDAPLDEIAKVAGSDVAEAIRAVREDRVNITPGYDGVYGKIGLP